jgi:hypothetical protein
MLRFQIMRWAFICFCLSLTSALGQPLGVQVRFAKDTYLMYEALPATVSIHNYSGREIQLDEGNQQLSLTFVVTTESGQMIRSLGRPTLVAPVIIPPGQTVAQTIDLLPLYELRDRGTYKVRAQVKMPVGSFESAPVRITIINGRQLWTQAVGLPVSDGSPQEYRTYTLLAWQGPREDSLYVSVRDDAHSMVYSLIPLGSFLTTREPEARIDRAGNLHVLFQNGPRSYGYVEVDPIARPLARAAHSDFTGRPTLTETGGEISVTGGEQTYPKRERVISDEELPPPTPPPPPKKPKRHWWWPFGSP